MFEDKPLFGHGPKMFRVKCSNKKYEVDQFSCATHPHNYSLQLLSETGIIGFIFFLLFYLSLLKMLFKLLISNLFKEKYSYVLIAKQSILKASFIEMYNQLKQCLSRL